MRFSRRQFHTIAGSAAIACGTNTFPGHASADQPGPLETFVPTRAITRGPLNHWFGYYDKREFDPTNRFVLSNETSFEGRGPTGDDVIKVGYVDTQADDAWHEIGSSRVGLATRLHVAMGWWPGRQGSVERPRR